MNKTKLTKVGLIGAAVGAVGLGVSAIVAGCRRHKTKKALLDTQVELGFSSIDHILKDAHIRELEEEIQKLKSGYKGEES